MYTPDWILQQRVTLIFQDFFAMGYPSRLAITLAVTALVACGDPTGSSHLTITPSDLALAPCAMQQLAAARSDGTRVVVKWASSRPEVAEIDSDGLTTAKRPGTTTITATAKADPAQQARVELVVRSDLQSFTVGGGATDTIWAVLPQPIFVAFELAEGCPAVGDSIRFSTTLVPSGQNGDMDWPVRLGEDEPPLYGMPGAGILEVATDSSGRATAVAQLGRKAGTHQVSIVHIGGTLQASVPITVLPGAPFEVQAFPRDTAIYAGAAYSLRGVRVIDREWNDVPHDVVLTSTDPAVATVTAQGTVEGSDLGRARFFFPEPISLDAGFVSVVPRGTLAVARVVEHSGINPAVLLLEMDGSIFRTAYESTATGYNVITAPSWQPTASELVLTDVTPGTISTRIMLSDTLGNARALLSQDHDADAHGGAFSPDGDWVYFGFGSELNRAPATGATSPEGVAQVYLARNQSRPSVSPDGSSLVVHDASDPAQIIHVDLATGATTPRVAGLHPSWSPIDDLVAYISEGRIWFMAPDGTSQRPITDVGAAYGDGLNWSPDGQWLVTRSVDDGHIYLIEAASGLALPLAFTAGISYPAWRP